MLHNADATETAERQFAHQPEGQRPCLLLLSDASAQLQVEKVSMILYYIGILYVSPQGEDCELRRLRPNICKNANCAHHA